TFADRNGNFEFDEGLEERGSYNLVAAVEVAAGEATKGKASADDPERALSSGARPMRALAYAAAGQFTADVLRSLGMSAALVADGMTRWGGEEALAGEAESKEDNPIRHSRAEDVLWFYSSILGAPALVLTLGLAGVWRRRRR